MKILIIDNDDVSAQLINARLEPMGHHIMVEKSKEAGVQLALENVYDLILFDPSPMNSAQSHVLNIRRSVRYYPYFLLLKEGANREQAVESSMNDFVDKPVDGVQLDEKIYHAEQLRKVLKQFGDGNEDFKSAGGVIAKSAFNQLFLSSLDRASRYGEKSYVLFIRLSNYKDTYHDEGPSSADNAVAALCKNLMELHRRSDVVGQTGKSEYCLLIQRPNDEQESIMAADRLTEKLLDFPNVFTEGGKPFNLHVRLMEIPTGKIIVEHNVTAKDKVPAA